jgi:trafficking protein particle complex subunit 1
LLGPDQGFFRYACSAYVLHHLETPTGYRFVLTTDPGVGDLRGALWHLYSEIFVGYALKNPLYQPGTVIDCTGFVGTVDGFIRSLPAFGGVGNTGVAAGAGNPLGGAGAVVGGAAGTAMTRL